MDGETGGGRDGGRLGSGEGTVAFGSNLRCLSGSNLSLDICLVSAKEGRGGLMNKTKKLRKKKHKKKSVQSKEICITC